MPLKSIQDAQLWLYKNVSDDPNLKQRWLSAQLLEKAIKHKYEGFEIDSTKLSRAISKRVRNCDNLKVPNTDNTYKVFHHFQINKKKRTFSFFYFAGNNSDELPHPPTANNSPNEQ